MPEKEPNDRPEQATDLPAPCEVAGRIDRRGDRDWFAFTAKKGETVVIDLWGDRLGVPTDFLFTVRSAKTPAADMAEKDDNPEQMSNTQFYARTTDPDPYTFSVPEDGKYEHEQTWNDDNGHSHIRAAMLGPSVMIPFAAGKLLTGEYQQVVLIDFDTRPRRRTVIGTTMP